MHEITTHTGSDTTLASVRQPRRGVLYVAPSSRERAWSRDRLLRIGTGAHVATNLTDVLQQLRTHQFGLCLVDLADDRAALSVIRVIRAQHPEVPVAGIIDPAYPLMAGDALQAGVIDLLPWPFDERDVALVQINAGERGGAAIGAAADLDDESQTSLIAHSPAMRQALEAVRAAASGSRGVLISGEPATGREIVARAIHRLDAVRSRNRFVVVDCAAHAPADLERNLFGVASEGASAERQTRVSEDCLLLQAQGGTLFFRAICDAPARLQSRLARLLRDREVTVEKGEMLELDVRPMASADGALSESVADGRLRRDLYDRFAAQRIDVPPLRKRREDLPQLVAVALRRACARQGRERALSRSAIAVLSALPWPGNARDLQVLLDKVVAGSVQPVIQVESILAHVRLDGLGTRVEEGVTLKEARARFERDCISAALVRHHGRVGEAARELGIQRTNLYRKVRQLKVAKSLLSSRK